MELCQVSGQTAHEERVNVVTHGLGFAASLVAGALLVWWAWSRGGGLDVVSCSIFAFSAAFLYAASTLYHGATCPKRKRILQNLDHTGIYLLIAGSYTPFMLGPLFDRQAVILLSVVWAVALLGIVLRWTRLSESRWSGAFVYLGLGWLAVFKLGSMVELLPLPGLILIITGGASYSLGVVFFLWDRLPYLLRRKASPFTARI